MLFVANHLWLVTKTLHVCDKTVTNVTKVNKTCTLCDLTLLNVYAIFSFKMMALEVNLQFTLSGVLLLVTFVTCDKKNCSCHKAQCHKCYTTSHNVLQGFLRHCCMLDMNIFHYHWQINLVSFFIWLFYSIERTCACLCWYHLWLWRKTWFCFSYK